MIVLYCVRILCKEKEREREKSSNSKVVVVVVVVAPVWWVDRDER